MRTVVLIAVSALALAGCDGVQNPFAKQAAKPPAAQAAATPAVQPTPPLPAASAPAPESPPGGAVAPETAAAPPPAAVAKPEAVRWSPADYGKRERRLAALIANAETRDASGETQRRADEGRYRRSRCTTRACIENSYAAEEAWLRQWEGSGEAK